MISEKELDSKLWFLRKWVSINVGGGGGTPSFLSEWSALPVPTARRSRNKWCLELPLDHAPTRALLRFQNFFYFVMFYFSILIFLLFILVLFCFVLSLFYFFPHVAVSCNGTCMLMILFLCFNHDVPILVLARCCSANVTSALSKLQFCCTHLKKKTNNNNAVKKVSCG